MNTINCSCGNTNSSGCCGCCKSCKFNPCAVNCSTCCEGSADYAYIYNTAAQTTAVGSAFTFSANGALSGTITHTAGTSEIVIGNTGVYSVNVFSDPAAASQHTVYKNGTPVEGATFASDGSAVSGKILIAAQSGDVITVVNTGEAEITHEASGTAAEAVVNAAVTITREF